MNASNNTIEVLLVEDDKINQMVVGAFLRKWGMRVTIANNGREAIMLILQKNFQIVLMDLLMPEMDGLEATTIIRAMDDLYFKTVPILMFTAHVLSQIKNLCLKQGITEFLSKPFDLAELNNKILEYAEALPITRSQLAGMGLVDGKEINFQEKV